MSKPKLTPKQLAERNLAAMERAYARAERALIRAALVGCVRRDPTEPNANNASASSRRVDVSAEVEQLRWDRNHLTWAERDMRAIERAAKRKGGRRG